MVKNNIFLLKNDIQLKLFVQLSKKVKKEGKLCHMAPKILLEYI
jgi:hypothetical protein